MTKTIFMTLATEHAKKHISATDNDIDMGYQMGLEKAMIELSQLPELKNDSDVMEIMNRLYQVLPALPI